MPYTAWKFSADHWRTICHDIGVRVSPRILAVGELLTADEFDPGGDGQQTLADYTLALDAYAAAGALADEAEHPPDLAGVLVLLDIAETCFTAALDRHAGRPVAARVFHCVENPLHGPAVNVPEGISDLRDWRPEQSQPSRFPTCADCLRRHRDRNSVDWLPAPISDPAAGGHGTILAVPYYEITRPRTAWSATGYGNIRGATVRDLVDRVLHGEHRMTPAQARQSVEHAGRTPRQLRPRIDLRLSGDRPR